jgi:hypothetical protein
MPLNPDSKFVTTFRALFKHEMEQLLTDAGFVDVKVQKIHDWLWENVYTARRPASQAAERMPTPKQQPSSSMPAAGERETDRDPATNFPWRESDFLGRGGSRE